jgi:hypothetical protein
LHETKNTLSVINITRAFEAALRGCRVPDAGVGQQ